MRQLAIIVCAALAACGGGENSEHRPEWTPASALEAAVPFEPVQLQVRQLNYIPATPVIERKAAARSDEAEFYIEDEQGARHGAFTLTPEFGKGYRELRLVMLSRRIGDTEPPARVRATCTSSSACEYQLANTYKVKVSDDLVQLVPRDDSLALVIRTMQVPENKRLTVTVMREDELVLRRDMVLLSEAPPAVQAQQVPVTRLNYIH
jgi:hypothetical protein